MSELRTYAVTYVEELVTEVERLTARCYPNAVIMIDGAGFYVQQKVADEVERLTELDEAIAAADKDEIENLKKIIHNQSFTLDSQRKDIERLTTQLEVAVDDARLGNIRIAKLENAISQAVRHINAGVWRANVRKELLAAADKEVSDE